MDQRCWADDGRQIELSEPKKSKNRPIPMKPVRNPWASVLHLSMLECSKRGVTASTGSWQIGVQERLIFSWSSAEIVKDGLGDFLSTGAPPELL